MPAEPQRPAVIVRNYDTGFGRAERRGREQYDRDVAALAKLGYEPIHSAASEKASAFGLKVGKLTVTYRLRAPASAAVEAAAATKVCPDCAETVLAAARVCRFCRYEFDGT